MNILFLSRRFYPEIGGVEKHVREVGKILVKKGYKVTVIAEKPHQTLRNQNQSLESTAKLAGEVDGINIFRINQGEDNWFKKFRIWKELFKHWKLIKDADIVHCHDVFFWYLPFRFLFPKKRIHTTFHGFEGKFPPSKKAIIVRKISEKLSRGSICIGEFIKKWYKANPNFVLYGGINGSPKKRVEANKKILFVGRLEEDTGIKEYIEGFKNLKNKDCRYSLDIVGDGNLKKELEKEIKSLDIKFLGVKENLADLIPSYSYIFTSGYLAILEALSFRKAVFALYSNKLKEDYLRMTPFKEYISIISKDKLIKGEWSIKDERLEKGYNWVQDQTWEKVTDIYLKLWKI